MWRILILVLLAAPALSHPTPQVRAVFQDGAVVFHDGNHSIETPFAIASVGKLFSSVAFLRLVDQGLLHPDDLAKDRVPQDVADGLGGLDGVTLTHLTTMTSGLPDYFDDAFLDAASDRPVADLTPEFAVSFAFDEPTLFDPGDGFDYSNTNYVLLQIVMERATGKPYRDIIQDEIFRPADLRQSMVFGNAPLPADFPKGHEGIWHIRDYYTGPGFADGGVLASAQDVAKFYAAIWNGDLLSPAGMRHLTTDPTGEGYGMGVILADDLVGHSGGDMGFSSLVVMNTTTGRVAVEFAGRSDGVDDWAWDAAME